MLLEVADLDVTYGRSRAVREVGLAVAEGEVVAVLGANGAGKSSLLSAVLGAVRARRGRVVFDGADVTHWSVARRVRRGLALVPEGRRILISLSVEENLLMGAYARADRAGLARDIERIYERFPNLAERRAMPASVLSGGEQQMLAIGRALVARPKLMMLDEPSLGLSPLLVQYLFGLLQEINRDGVTILLVEQNTRLALEIADRAYVLERGRVVLEGAPDDLKRDRGLQEAYLGQSTHRETGAAGGGDRAGATG